VSGTAPGSADALVVGAGVVGLAAACQLRRLGARRVKVLERFAAGHRRGSSHGAARITRSSYGERVYAELMKVANAEDWPRLERESGLTLVHRTEGCFFGPPEGPFEEFARVVADAGVDVERLGAAEARRRFPQFRFDGCAGALADRTAGVVAAAETLTALRGVAGKLGVEMVEGVEVLGLDASAGAVRVETTAGTFTAERVVVAAGPWVVKLFPELASRLTPLRQTVAYFQLDGPGPFGAGSGFPVWAYLGPDPNGLWYGLPPFGGDGVKAAHHRTSGPADDPDAEAPALDADARAIEAFLARRFTARVAACVKSETCFYTCTRDEAFLLDVHPSSPRLVIASPCSGHGFKFAPLTGRIAAELAMTRTSTVKPFTESRERFSTSGAV
jgi:sarcosine oxidase